jgi:hypothetical protein
MTVKFERTDGLGFPIGKPKILTPNTNLLVCEQSLLRPKIEIEVFPNPTGSREQDSVLIKSTFGKEIKPPIVLIGNEINDFGRSISDRVKNGFIISSV